MSKALELRPEIKKKRRAFSYALLKGEIQQLSTPNLEGNHRAINAKSWAGPW